MINNMNVFTRKVSVSIYRGLVVLALLLALLILGVSLWVLFLREDTPKPNSAPVPSSQAVTGGEAAGSTIFTAIGRLRLSTTDSFMVILSVSFPYNPNDKAFSEELVSRIGEFRTAAAEYFGGFTAANLAGKDESLIKSELLSRYNSFLRLGKIDLLYFNDYMIIE